MRKHGRVALGGRGQGACAEINDREPQPSTHAGIMASFSGPGGDGIMGEAARVSQLKIYRFACVLALGALFFAYANHFHNALPFRRRPHDSEQPLHPGSRQHPVVFSDPEDLQLAAGESELPAAADDNARAGLPPGRRPRPLRVSRDELPVVRRAVRGTRVSVPAVDGPGPRVAGQPMGGIVCRLAVRASHGERRDGELHHRALRHPLHARRRALGSDVRKRRRGAAMAHVSDSGRRGPARQGAGRDRGAAAVSVRRAVRAPPVGGGAATAAAFLRSVARHVAGVRRVRRHSRRRHVECPPRSRRADRGGPTC